MSLIKQLISGGLVVAFLAAASSQPVRAQDQDTLQGESTLERITVGSDGFGGGEYADISADGRYVAFESHASDLVAGHQEDSLDVFVYDRRASHVERVSTPTSGQPIYNPGAYTSPPSISGDGRFIAFASESSLLVPNDLNGVPDIFLRDRQTGSTELISVGMNGQASNSYSFTPAISANGRFVVFQSWADNIVKNDSNNSVDIFIRDRELNITEIVSISTSEQQGTDWNEYGYSSVSVSGDGRYVAFSYESLPVEGLPAESSPGVYLRDRQERTTSFIAAGEFPALSANGRYLSFVASADLTEDDQNLRSDVYLYDIQSGEFERASVAAGTSEESYQWIGSAPDVSNDGRRVVFVTDASLVPQDTNEHSDVYLYNRDEKNITLLTIATGGEPANGSSYHAVIAADGSAVAFYSYASNLVEGDTNEAFDVFLYQLPALQVDLLTFYLPVLGR